LAKRPKKRIAREEYPALFQLVEKVSLALGVSRDFDILVNEKFNAGFTQAGWRRRNLFYIGLPLWFVLDNGERIALMAHEVAHKVNGDASRGFLMHTAILALNNWYDLLHPNVIWDAAGGYGYGFIGFFTRFSVALANLLRLLLSYLPRILAYLLCHLLWRDSQRSEYLADYLAADLTGTKPITSMLDKLHCYDEYVFTIQKITLNPDLKLDFFNEFKNRVAHMPASELERIRRLQEIEQSTLDATHPPTVYRIKMLEAHLIASPSVSLDDFPFTQIENELQKWKVPIQEKLIDLYKDHLYY
jgi:heat shock protein HtpX